MSRRTTWLARLLSVATGPLILGGCATQTVVFDPATGQGGISAQPGRSELVIAAPHGTSDVRTADIAADLGGAHRSEEHTSELQSPCNLVCRLLLEKKKKKKRYNHSSDAITAEPDYIHDATGTACQNQLYTKLVLYRYY